MALSTIDRILIQRTQEVMEAFTRADFRASDGRRATDTCPAPGCIATTRGGPCKKHWRMWNKKAAREARVSGVDGRTRK
jgi:hypothetical protein